MSRKRDGAWSEDDGPLDGEEHADGGYAEEDDFDYEEYIEREFPGRAIGRKSGGWGKWGWRVVVIVVCLLLIWRFLVS